MKIAITGKKGFIGKHLIRKLESSKQYNLSYFDRKIHNLFHVDLLKSFVSQKDIIIHLAGLAGIHGNTPSGKFLTVNTLATSNLLEAVKQDGKKNCLFLLASSSQVYAHTAYEKYYKETDVTEPNNVFGLSKLLAEQILLHYTNQKVVKGMILRMSNIYGTDAKPYYNSVIATFQDQVKTHQPLKIFNNGKDVRDYICIDDVVTAIEQSLQLKPITYEILNISTRRGASLSEIVQIITSIQKNVQVEYMQSKSSFINNKYYLLCDNSKARKMLDWRPKISLEEGIHNLFS